jgi:hypothetical protein
MNPFTKIPAPSTQSNLVEPKRLELMPHSLDLAVKTQGDADASA